MTTAEATLPDQMRALEDHFGLKWP
jgi:hypothetical protein